MRIINKIMLIAAPLISFYTCFGQCADQENIYPFVYDGHSYEVVRENKSWTDASSCAVSRDGYLAEINDVEEQDAVFNELVNNAEIIISNTENQFGTASIWLGGSDAEVEGDWIWDGNNDAIGPQFWSGGPDGSPVGGLYSNWGISPPEPDNSGGQDHLTIIIKPTAVNFGLWNDLISTNSIYYLIEYDFVLSIQDLNLKSTVDIYPNPFKNFITVDNNNPVAIKKIDIFNLMGQQIKSVYRNELINDQIDVTNLQNGLYILNVHFENGNFFSQKIVK